jgi:hypothetical protein
MNCEEIKKNRNQNGFGILQFVSDKRKPSNSFYFALDREEKTPSLSVDFMKNRAFDFGTGKAMM